MAIRHNKKRNSGMLGEFFAMYISEAIVSRHFDKVASAKKLWNKHVRPGSELQKEMSLFKALEGSFESKQVAYAVLQEVKSLCRKLNKEKLEGEKTSLIREINNTFKNEGFFDKPIKEYVELASVQVLLNYCSSKTLRESVINPAMAEIEDRILSVLNKSKKEVIPQRSLKEVLSLTEDDVDGLVVNIMREKLNSKFAPKLTEDQKTILKQHVFGSDPRELTKTLAGLRDETICLIDEELSQTNKKIELTQRTKLTDILALLKEDYRDVSKTDDKTVTFYMTISKLNDELKDEK